MSQTAVEPAEAALGAAGPDYRALFQAVPGLYLVLDPQMRIVAASDAYCQATRNRREHLMGRTVFDVFTDDPHDAHADGVHNLRQSLQRVLRTRAVDAMPVQKFSIRSANRSAEPLEVRYWSPLNSPVLNPDGSLACIIHRIEDVTEFVQRAQREQAPAQSADESYRRQQRMEAEILARSKEVADANRRLKQANLELERLYEKTRELDELKSRFFANVSHELRTPLTLIAGPASRCLAAENLSADARRDLEIVDNNARILLRYVNDLLDVAGLEAGRMRMRYTQFDLALLVRLTASHFETVASDRRIRFGIDAHQELLIQADFEKIHRILLNLLANAFRQTPLGGYISLWLETAQEHAFLHIQDNGPGIPEEQRAAVFEPFHQGEGGGAGLGLAIVREFAGLHHGSVAVSEAPGGGGHFMVRLPLRAPAGTELQSLPPSDALPPPLVEELRVQPMSAAGTQESDPNKPLVLVVEDNPDMNRFVASVLGRHYRVATAYDGKEGLDMALAFHPDLIVSDVMMPRMSGERMIRALREHRDISEVPVIMLTAKADEALRVELLQEGVQDYINKPFSAEELLARVGARIRAHQRREAALKQLRREMEDLLKQHVASQTAAGIAHELNQPLNAVLTYTEAAMRLLQRDAPEPGKLQHALEGAVAQARRAGQVVRELLQFFRGGETVIEAVDLAQAIQRALAVVRDGSSERFETVLNLAPGLPPLWANRLQVEKVLVNLVSNGLEAMRAAGAAPTTICISTRSTPDGGMAHVTVQDTGIGLTEEEARRIFTPFYTTKPQGIGMGLSISRSLIEANGGRIWGEPAPGRGALFHFTLPFMT